MRIKLLFAFMLLAIAAFGQQNPIQIDANGLTQTLAAGGIVNRGQIVKINSSGQVVPMATTDTSGAVGIAATSQQNVGQVVAVSIGGSPLVQIDSGGCAAGNFVAISTITAGAGHCSATSGTGQIGVALSISSPGSNFWNVQWTGVGGGGGGGVPGQFSVKTYGAVGDARSTKDCSVTLNSTTITSASNPWVVGDVGKFFYSAGGYGNPPFAPQKITGFNSAGSITVANAAGGTGSGFSCVWFTQKDTAAFTSALAAAKASLSAGEPNLTGPTLAYPSLVYCPPGGYVIDGPFFNQVYAIQPSLGVSFQGAGRSSCMIYMSSDFVAGANALLGYVALASGFFMDGFTIFGENMAFSLGNLPGLQFNTDSEYRLSNFTLEGYTNAQDTSFAAIYTNAGTHLKVDNITISGADQASIFFNTTGNVLGINNTLSNAASCPNLNVNAGSRGGNAQPFTWIGGLIDECGNNTIASTLVQANIVANFIGVPMYGESPTVGALNCLGRCYITDGDIGSFNNGQNQPAVVIGAGGFVHATGTWFRGNGTSPAVNGPSTASFLDCGNNRFMTGTGVVFTDVTAAQYSTLGFTGGIVPQSCIQMPSNTVFAVTGNLLATTQNLAQILLPVNQQLKNITAQSGGTTPANSSCATPPVITLSDGTRSATMTMTSGKTFWRSDVDAVTNINQVFASGAVLTISIGANTCATPPSNVSVTYNLQSVLNP